MGNGNIVKPFWDILDRIVRRKTNAATNIQFTKELAGVDTAGDEVVVNYIMGFSHYAPVPTVPGRKALYSTTAPVELLVSIRFKKELPFVVKTPSEVFTVQAKLRLSQEDAQNFGMLYALPAKCIDAAPFQFSNKNETFAGILSQREKDLPRLVRSDLVELNKWIALFKGEHEKLIVSSLTAAEFAALSANYLEPKAEVKGDSKRESGGYLSQLTQNLQLFDDVADAEQQRLIYVAYRHYDKNRQWVLQQEAAQKVIDTAAYLMDIESHLERAPLAPDTLSQCASLEQAFWQQLQWHAHAPEYAMFYLFEPLLIAADGYPELPLLTDIENFCQQQEDYRFFIRLFPFNQLDKSSQLQLYSVFTVSLQQAIAKISKLLPKGNELLPAAKDLAKRLAMQQLVSGLMSPPHDLNSLQSLATARCVALSSLYKAPLLQGAPSSSGFFSPLPQTMPVSPNEGLVDAKRTEVKSADTRDSKHVGKKKRHVFGSDFDGCLGYLPDAKKQTAIPGSSLNRGQAILQYQLSQQTGWLAYIISSVAKEDSRDVTVTLNSSRQSIESDLSQIYLGMNKKDSSYFATMRTFIEATNKHFCDNGVNISLQLDEFLMADVAQQLRAGQSFADAMAYYGPEPKRTAKKPTLPRVERDFIVDDASKVFTLYADMQREALKTPDEEVIFHFPDDDEEILQRLQQFFQRHPDWIPSNVVLRLRKYAPAFSDLVTAGEFSNDIVGCGKADANYASVVRERARLLRELGDEMYKQFREHSKDTAVELLMLLDANNPAELPQRFQFKLADVLYARSNEPQILSYIEANKTLIGCFINSAKTAQGQDSVLACAIRFKVSAAVMQALLKVGADPLITTIVEPSARTTVQQSALHLAVECANEQAVTVLLQDPQRCAELLFARDSQGDTALHRAVRIAITEASKQNSTVTSEPRIRIVALLVNRLEQLGLRLRGCGLEKNHAGETPSAMLYKSPTHYENLSKLICDAQETVIVSPDRSSPSGLPERPSSEKSGEVSSGAPALMI
jgi:hypothetical protein